MNSHPLVSIITTFYNSVKLGDFVHKSMDCLLNQTYQNLELICVNDGSEDETLEQLQSYAKKDLRIKIIDKKNQGVAQYAKAAGQDVATGEWIMLFDHDDKLSYDAIEKAIQKTIENTLLDAVSMSIKLTYIDGKVREFQRLDLNSKEGFIDKDRVLNGMEAFSKTVGKYDFHFRGITKKELFKRHSFQFTEKLLNADEIVERLIFKEVAYFGVCDGIYEHFIYQNSSAKSYSIKKVDIVRTNSILRQIFQDEGVYEDRRKIFEVGAYKSLVSGMKIFQHLKSTLNKEDRKKYQRFLVNGFTELDKATVTQEFKGFSKFYHKLLLSSFPLMMSYYRIKN